MPDAVYDHIGAGYATRRRADPRIQRAVDRALGSARRILNVVTDKYLFPLREQWFGRPAA